MQTVAYPFVFAVALACKCHVNALQTCTAPRFSFRGAGMLPYSALHVSKPFPCQEADRANLGSVPVFFNVLQKQFVARCLSHGDACILNDGLSHANPWTIKTV